MDDGVDAFEPLRHRRVTHVPETPRHARNVSATYVEGQHLGDVVVRDEALEQHGADRSRGTGDGDGRARTPCSGARASHGGLRRSGLRPGARRTARVRRGRIASPAGARHACRTTRTVEDMTDRMCPILPQTIATEAVR